MPGASRASRFWKLALQVAVTGGILYLVLRTADWGAMRQAASTANWLLVVPALLLMPVQYVWAALLWRYLGRHLDPELTVGQSARALLGAHAIAIWTPGRAGEFAARPTLMPRGSRLSWAAAIVAEGLLHLPVPLLLGSLCAGLLQFPGARWLSLGGLGISTVIFALVLRPGWLIRLSDRFGQTERLRFLTRLSSTERMVLMGGYGVRYLLFAVQLGLVVTALDATAVISPLVALAGALSVFAAKAVLPLLSFADLGIREGATVLVFGAEGLSTEASLQAALLVYAINVLLPSLAGAWVWLTHRGRNRT